MARMKRSFNRSVNCAVHGPLVMPKTAKPAIKAAPIGVIILINQYLPNLSAYLQNGNSMTAQGNTIKVY
jgi:hypothetical protein